MSYYAVFYRYVYLAFDCYVIILVKIFNVGMKNKIMKKIMICCLLWVTCFTGMIQLTSYAAPDVTINLNGEEVYFPDAQPFINDDQRTMVPIRFVVEELGGKVAWNDSKQQVKLNFLSTEIIFTIGEQMALVNGNELYFDTSIILKDNRTYVPLRFISETLSAKVIWDAKNEVAVVQTPDYAASHIAMQTSRIEDLSDPYLYEEFYNKFMENDPARPYESFVVFERIIGGARKLSEEIIIDKDMANENFTISVPEYNQTKYEVRVSGVTDFFQSHSSPGKYEYLFKDALGDNGYLFEIVISDNERGGRILVFILGYKQGDKFVVNEGSLARNTVYSEKTMDGDN